MKAVRDSTPYEIVRYIYAHAVSWQNNKVAWLEIAGDEVILRIWYFRNYSVKGRQETRYTECVRKISGDNHIIWRNGYFNYYTMAQGFQPVYVRKDVKRYYQGYEDIRFQEEDFDRWYDADADLFDMCIPVVNLSILDETKYKYCAYPNNCDLIRYLKLYEKDPSVEFFGKIGLYPCPSLVRAAKKDRSFCRFLRENAIDAGLFGPQATLYAYKNKIGIVEARRMCEHKARVDREIREDIPEAHGTCIDKKKLYGYLTDLDGKNGGGYRLASSYNDYLRAVKGLGLDLHDTKNAYPNDFWRMHDLRTHEFAALQAKEDRKKRKQLYKAFEIKAKELKKLEWSNGYYTIIIPDSVADLIHEGAVLHHCVGKLGYDLKVVKGTSIIAFLRKAEDIKQPLVTIEYRIDLGKIAQCYGRNDTRPEKEICDYAEEWAEYVKKKIKGEKENGESIRGKVKARQGAGA